MLEVWRPDDHVLGRAVAMKTLASPLMSDPRLNVATWREPLNVPIGRVGVDVDRVGGDACGDVAGGFGGVLGEVAGDFAVGDVAVDPAGDRSDVGLAAPCDRPAAGFPRVQVGGEPGDGGG